MNYDSKNQLQILDDFIGKDAPCYIIAEIGINHNGDINLAKKLIDLAIDAGADAVKFQKRSLSELYREDALQDPNIESQGFELLLDVLKEVELTKSDYQDIMDYCKSKDITFFCTPWDTKSVDFLEELEIPAYKVASADMTNLPLIRHMCKTKKPLIVSTGMSTLDEIEKTVDFLKREDANFILLHCNSTYPAPIETLNLNLIPKLKEKFNVPIGYSGHEPGIIPTLVAVDLGAVAVERHITLDKTMEGIDQAASLEPQEFSDLVKFIRESEKARGKPVKKMTRGEILQREVLGKSIVSCAEIEIGDTFSADNIEVKGPAKGLSPQYYYEILGRKSVRKIKKGEYLLSDDI